MNPIRPTILEKAANAILILGILDASANLFFSFFPWVLTLSPFILLRY